MDQIKRRVAGRRSLCGYNLSRPASDGSRRRNGRDSVGLLVGGGFLQDLSEGPRGGLGFEKSVNYQRHIEMSQTNRLLVGGRVDRLVLRFRLTSPASVPALSNCVLGPLIPTDINGDDTRRQSSSFPW
jgi:hypothetical protein